MSRTYLAAIVAGATLLIGVAPVSAAALLGPGGGSCTTINCQAASFRGVVANEAGFAVPFTMQLQGVAGPRCMRLETTQADTDLEMVVVSPDGTTYRDDDSGAGNLSLIKIPFLFSGFYTVHMSRYDGAPTNAAFTLLAGFYPTGNPNCAGPTPPTAASSAERSVAK